MVHGHDNLPIFLD